MCECTHAQRKVPGAKVGLPAHSCQVLQLAPGSDKSPVPPLPPSPPVPLGKEFFAPTPRAVEERPIPTQRRLRPPTHCLNRHKRPGLTRPPGLARPAGPASPLTVLLSVRPPVAESKSHSAAQGPGLTGRN